MTITCPIHGDFVQKPNTHISGKSGCYECGREIRAGRYTADNVTDDPGNIYVLIAEHEDEQFLKIGITKHTATARYYGKINHTD